MNILQPEKTFILYSPLATKNELVRTGVPCVDSFFHSILYCHFSNYQNSDKKERQEIVNNFSKRYRTNPIILIDDFYTNLTTKKFAFSLNINFYNNEIKTDKDLKAFKIIRDILPLKKIKTFYTETNAQNMLFNYTSDSFTQVTKGKIDKSKIDFCLNKLNRFLSYVFHFDINISESLINIIAELIDRNIYILDTKSRVVSKKTKIKKRNSIILLSFQDKHFEPVGKLCNKNTILYDFEPDDKFIEKIFNEAHKMESQVVSDEKLSDNESEDSSQSESEDSSQSDSEDSSESSKTRSSSSSYTSDN